MKVLDAIVAILLIIGGLNWGIIGVAEYNVVDGIFGYDTILSRIIYILVGISAIYTIFQWKVMIRRCK